MREARARGRDVCFSSRQQAREIRAADRNRNSVGYAAVRSGDSGSFGTVLVRVDSDRDGNARGTINTPFSLAASASIPTPSAEADG